MADDKTTEGVCANVIATAVRTPMHQRSLQMRAMVALHRENEQLHAALITIVQHCDADRAIGATKGGQWAADVALKALNHDRL